MIDEDDTLDVHGYFGLSYANFAVFPRALLQSMPEEWQERFVRMMIEFDHYWSDLPDGFLPKGYRVQPTENGNLVSFDDYTLPHYNRGRTRVQKDGTVTGARPGFSS